MALIFVGSFSSGPGTFLIINALAISRAIVCFNKNTDPDLRKQLNSNLDFFDFLDFGKIISNKIFTNFTIYLHEDFYNWVKDFGLSNFDFSFNFVKIFIYAVIFYFISGVFFLIMLILKNLVCWKFTAKVYRFFSNLMFFNYIIRFSLEAYLTLVFSASLSIINYWNSDNWKWIE